MVQTTHDGSTRKAVSGEPPLDGADEANPHAGLSEKLFPGRTPKFCLPFWTWPTPDGGLASMNLGTLKNTTATESCAKKKSCPLRLKATTYKPSKVGIEMLETLHLSSVSLNNSSRPKVLPGILDPEPHLQFGPGEEQPTAGQRSIRQAAAVKLNIFLSGTATPPPDEVVLLSTLMLNTTVEAIGALRGDML